MFWLLQLQKSISIRLTGREAGRGEGGGPCRKSVGGGGCFSPRMSAKCTEALRPPGVALQHQPIFHPQASCLHDQLTRLPAHRHEVDTCPGKDLTLGEDQIWGFLCLFALLVVFQKANHHLTHQKTSQFFYKLPIHMVFGNGQDGSDPALISQL